MHPYVLIMLIAAIACAALASAILARNPDARSSRSTAGILMCGSAWGLLDVFGAVAQEPGNSVRIMRLISLAYLPIGPLSILLLGQIRRDLRARLRPYFWGSAALTGLLIVATISTPWFVVAVEPVVWGWSAVHGPGYAFAVIAAMAPPAAAFALISRGGGTFEHMSDSGDGRLMAFALGLPVTIVLISDILYPLFDPNGPRLGTLSIALISGTLWLRSTRSGRSIPASGTAAREILDSLTDGVALLARDGRLRAANETLARLAAVERDALLDLRATRLLPGLSVDDFWAELSERETMFVIPDGPTIPVAVSTMVIADRRGSNVGFVLVVKDQRQVVELRRRLVTSGRLAAVGELAAGIAHEVNNPIAFIQANLNLLGQHIGGFKLEEGGVADGSVSANELAGCQTHIDASLGEISRVAAIVREVTEFAHMGTGDSGPQDVNALLDSAVHLATLHLGDRACVERSYAQLPGVMCSGQELRQVFLSILLNAIRAVGDEGALVLVSRDRGDEVVVSFEDPGWRISPTLVERDFDPAFDGDSAMGASGLGLSLSYQMLQQLGGDLRVSGVPTGGTRVCVHLPVHIEAEDDPYRGCGR